jgi:hypothetical protein
MKDRFLNWTLKRLANVLITRKKGMMVINEFAIISERADLYFLSALEVSIEKVNPKYKIKFSVVPYLKKNTAAVASFRGNKQDGIYLIAQGKDGIKWSHFSNMEQIVRSLSYAELPAEKTTKGEKDDSVQSE